LSSRIIGFGVRKFYFRQAKVELLHSKTGF
jgi:hypothetical protein